MGHLKIKYKIIQYLVKLQNNIEGKQEAVQTDRQARTEGRGGYVQ